MPDRPTARHAFRPALQPLEGRALMSVDITTRAFFGSPGSPTATRGQDLQIESFSWGATTTSGAASRSPDSLSPIIRQIAQSRTPLTRVELTLRIDGIPNGRTGNRAVTITYKLSNATITSFTSTSSGPAGTRESLSLNFTKVEVVSQDIRDGVASPARTVSNPTFSTKGLDLNGDGKTDPLLVPVVLGKRDRAGTVIVVVPGDLNGDGRPDRAYGTKIDLDGNGQADSTAAVSGSSAITVAINRAGTVSRRVMTDRNRDGREDPFFLLDLDGDSRADILLGFRPNTR